MFNLLVIYKPNDWDKGTYQFPKRRVALEYTVNETSERYKDFTKDSLEELKSSPTLFVIENEAAPSKIGYINDIRIRTDTIVIDFEFDLSFPELLPGTIESLRKEIDLGD